MHGNSDVKYWELVGTVWTTINIYEGPEVFRETFENAPRSAALLFAAHFCQSEVCSGGFEQFFWNSTGVLAPEAVEGMKMIACPELGSVIQSAMDRLVIPFVRDRACRQRLVHALPKSYFDADDEQFYKLISNENGGFEAAANRFVSEST